MVEHRVPKSLRHARSAARFGLLRAVLLLWLAACGRRSTGSTTETEAVPSASTEVASAQPNPLGSAEAPLTSSPGLSPATRRLACELPRPITVHALFTKLPPLEGAVASTRQLFASLEAISCPDGAGSARPSRIRTKLELLEQGKDDARAKAAGFENDLLPVGTDGQSMALAWAVSGFVVGEGEQTFRAHWHPADTDPASLEYELLRLMKRLHASMPGGRKLRIGVMHNGGPMGLRTALLDSASAPVSELLAKAGVYDLVDVERTGTGPIDPTLRGLLVLTPDRAATQQELARIDDFVLLGGKTLVLVMSGVVSGDEVRSFEPLLTGYGLGLRFQAVFDHGAPFIAPAKLADGTKVDAACPALSVVSSDQLDRDERIDVGFPPFFRHHGALFSFASPITLAPERQPQARVRTLARSSAFATTLQDKAGFCAPRPAPTSGERYDLAGIAEGRLKSALKPDSAALSASESRVLLIASPTFFANPMLVAQAAMPPEQRDMFQLLANRFASERTGEQLRMLFTLFDWMDDDPDEVALARRIPVGPPKLGPIPKDAVPLALPPSSASPR